MDQHNVYSPFSNDLNSVPATQIHQGFFPAVDQSGHYLHNADSSIAHFGNTVDQDGQDAADDNDAKRRRIARVRSKSVLHGKSAVDVTQACDMCRKKKIKCDGRLPK